MVAAEENATAAVDAESALLRAGVGGVSVAAAAGIARQASTTCRPRPHDRGARGRGDSGRRRGCGVGADSALVAVLVQLFAAVGDGAGGSVGECLIAAAAERWCLWRRGPARLRPRW